MLVAQPPFWPPYLGIVSEDAFVPMHHPGVDTDNRTLFEPFSTYFRASRWNDSFELQPKRRMDTSGFLHAGI